MSGAAQSKVSLLIIDDNPASLKSLSNSLAQPGLEILKASGLGQGLDILRKRHPAIVLADLAIPHKGMGVLERIIQIDSAAAVILMAAKGS